MHDRLCQGAPATIDELGSSTWRYTLFGAYDRGGLGDGEHRGDVRESRLATLLSRDESTSREQAQSTQGRPGIIEKLLEVRRRVREGDEGFDAFAITVVSCRNDGTPVQLVETPPAPQPGDIYHYESMIHRLAQLYEQKFRDIRA